MRLLIATGNPGKTRELTLYLQDAGIEVVTPAEVGLAELDPEETGATFQDNAELKAVEYGDRAGILTVADDSGLVIDALNGQPGVKSKRFIEGSDEDRNQHVLKLLTGQTNRQARFVCVLCLYDPQTQIKHNFTGIVEGSIAHQPKGEEGFGYDPIFLPEGQTHSMAELDIKTKNTMSHRARALAQLRQHLLKEKRHE